MTARQDELQVHELTLSGGSAEGNPAEEAFTTQGTGSHFESRVSELVVLAPTDAGLAGVSDKVEQLVAKGFHNIVVNLSSLNGSLEVIGPLDKARATLETWAGTLRVSNASEEVKALLGTLQGVEIHATQDAAIEAYRKVMNEDEGEPAESYDASNDWGWGTADADVAKATTPRLPVAELLVDDSELPKLDKDLRKVLLGGKKHVSLRLHFSRPMREQDVQILIACRDLLAKEGGQLALVAVPQDALKWLRLLDFEREFLIVESGDEADAAHNRHAAGESPLPSSAKDDAPFAIVSQDGSAYVIRPRASVDAASVRRTNLEALLLAPAGGGDLSGLVERLASESTGALINLNTLRDASRSQTLGSLAEASVYAASRSLALACANVSHEVSALLPALGATLPTGRDLEQGVLALASVLHQRSAFDELRLVLQSETLSPGTGASSASASALSSGSDTTSSASGLNLDDSSLSFGSDSGIQIEDIIAVPSASALGSASSEELDELRVRFAKAEGESQRLAEELAAAKSKSERLEQERQAAQSALNELQASLRRSERQIAELEQAQVLAERRVREAESSKDHVKADTERLNGELAKLRQELDEARAQLEQTKSDLETATEAASSGGEAAVKVVELQGELESARQETQRALEEAKATQKRLQGELKAAKAEGEAVAGRLKAQLDTLERAQNASDAAKLATRVNELEEERAKILTEAETEIERLTSERRLLQEELESAGEMIERLGKELELS